MKQVLKNSTSQEKTKGGVKETGAKKRDLKRGVEENCLMGFGWRLNSRSDWGACLVGSDTASGSGI